MFLTAEELITLTDCQRINLGHDLIEAKRKLLDLDAGRPVASAR